MTKSIDTLKEDMQHVLNTGEGWTREITQWVAFDISESLNRQFSAIGGRSSRKLRLSSIGTPCERKLWYSVNSKFEPESLPPHVRNKFIFGDLTESYILGIAKAAGHSVEGLQTRLDVHGIIGHRDCIIDGMLIDVKSAASQSFQKFKRNALRDDDPFGYISQLSSYLYGSRDDPLLTEKTRAGFLAFDKQSGDFCVDIYDMTEDIANKEEEIKRKKEVVKQDSPPDRPKWPKYYRGELQEEAEDWAEGQSGNRKLSTNCSYCDYKKECWPGLRTFIYSKGPVYLTKVEREPGGNVFEVKDEDF